MTAIKALAVLGAAALLAWLDAAATLEQPICEVQTDEVGCDMSVPASDDIRRL